ncbi:MAG: SDR family NAD(P)-dependent oxidoreductase [Planctomycetales bacterium]|nr:SDR family NAD(P)-dependent oxidoreductase [Planctomycetales bacterium]
MKHNVHARNGLGQSVNEPIAIIGLGCRFPGGVHDWKGYWQLLNEGLDGVSETPATRWSLQQFYAAGKALPGKTQSRWGGYVDAIDQFDPQLFGISPREAASMDPQQRMLLEVAYRAMEDAGQPLSRVAGRPISVFVGISSFDYAVAGLSFQDRGVIDAYNNTGSSSSIAANRVSYCFDLRGPSVAVDTACSSSLVAVHMACESIWRGEAEMALAGGVNALLLPDFYVAFSQLGVLSPDGRCKSFDARANGYVRSEGAGMVVLKPLHAALRDKDPVYAVVRSTALNQDGRTPGMTVPSQAAQEALIRSACAKARVLPSEIQYVEAHGTGTPVGDPIEASAVGSVIGAGRTSDEACFIGSVKTNIGHLEAGAGIASLIKVALALHHRRIPAHLHFEKPNPEIDFRKLGLRVATQSLNWDSEGNRLAGINGFGYGGANAHVILEQAPSEATHSMFPEPTAVRGTPSNQFDAPVLLPLSAKSKAALAQTATQLADWLESEANGYHLAEIAGYLALRRSHLDIRTTACATLPEEMVGQLRTIAASNSEELDEGLSATKLAHGPAFVCSGQGPQWWGMGRGLLKYSPAFRTVIKRCDHEFAKYGDWSLMTELMRTETQSRMQRTAIAQPSIFAVQIALAAVWESWGIKPTVVVGHSVGEIAAAYLSGALCFEDACRVAFYRGQTMDLASSHGAMLAAGLSPADVPQWLAGFESTASMAAINGPSSVTLSGEADTIELLAQRLEQQGVFCRRLAVEYAFHSPQMEPVCAELLRALSNVQPMKTSIPMISSVTGEEIDGTELDAEYWWQNVRQAVRFSDAMNSLANRGCAVVVEIGPHPVLAYSINECFADIGCSVRTVPSLNRQQDDLQVITKALGSLYSFGFDINWSGFYNTPRRKIPLPTYPFQRQTCWSESTESRFTRLMAPSHPLLGQRLESPSIQWQQRIDLRLQSYLRDHQVRGTVLYPVAAMIESAIAAAISQSDTSVARLQRLRLHNPCVLDDVHSQTIQTTYDEERRQLRLAFRESESTQWRPLATTEVSAYAQPPKDINAHTALRDARARCDQTFESGQLYDYCQQTGLHYGPEFRSVVSGQRRAGEAIAEVTLANSITHDADYHIHPALLDGCFHAMLVADPNFDFQVEGLYLPNEIREVNFFQRPSNSVTVHARMLSKTERSMICDLDIYDDSGQLCISLRHFQSKRVNGVQARQATEDLIYGFRWQAMEFSDSEPTSPAPAHWIVFMDEGRVGRELVQRLMQRGDQLVEVYRHNSQVAQSASNGFYQVDPESRASFTSMFQEASSALGSKVHGIIYLWGLDVPQPHQLNTSQLEASCSLTTLAPLHLAQAWELLPQSDRCDLILVTSGAQSQDSELELTSVAQAPLVGFGRVVASESSRFSTTLVDLPAEPFANDIERLFSEIVTENNEDEVLLRDTGRYVRRFAPVAQQSLLGEAVDALPSRLQVGKSSGIEELHYRTVAVSPLRPGEVEIEVVATGLNFSDVMKALDLYPGLPDGPVELGAECAGRISRTGPGSDWSVGDEVIAVAPGAFATHVTVNSALVARKPISLSFEQAATIPIAFMTAAYALHECARLNSGDSILVHSASGGVGLAAIQLANLAGIHVYATAGTEEKREFVRLRGARCVMDSRSLAFADETLAATANVGVDAVLNSLPGEAITKGLSILKKGGRFLEIGKRDIYADAPMGLFPFRNNLSMFVIDLDQLLKEQPARMGRLLNSLIEKIEQGELHPLPTTSYDCNDTIAAFKFMQQGKHIGKVAVTYPSHPADVRVGEFEPVQFNSRGTYWLAGGLGGFGLEIAKWMVDHGAKSLVLTGRSPSLSTEAEAAILQMESCGASISIMPADITQADEVKRVLNRIDLDLPKLVGIFHTAMVLEDKLLIDLDRETLQRVLRPKVLGGWNLHQQSLGRELECFVLFSSLSSVFGHAGQANYSAANALLDSLAYYRRAQGLPALVLNWGHLGQVGYLAQRSELGKRLERQGVMSFTVDEATNCLEYALKTRAVQLSILRIDWSVWRGLGLTNRVSPKFAHLIEQSAEAEVAGIRELPSAAALRAVVGVQRLAMVDRLLRNKAGSLLGIPTEDIQADRTLLEMGLDSLMAVEMRNWIESQMEISVPISALMKSSTLGELTEEIGEHIGDNPTPQVAAANRSEPEDDVELILNNLEDMGADQVSELLGRMLREQEQQ